MGSPRFESVDDYLESLDPAKATTIRAIIASILGAFPELECKLAWNVPQIHRNGAYVFGIGAAKNHLLLNPWSRTVLDTFRARLAKSYVVLKDTFQVPVDWKVDDALLVDLVRARLAELEES